jgi:hypothetical protein
MGFSCIVIFRGETNEFPKLFVGQFDVKRIKASANNRRIGKQATNPLDTFRVLSQADWRRAFGKQPFR